MTEGKPARSRAGALLDQIESLNLQDRPLSKLSVLSVPDEIALGDAKIRRHIAYALMAVFAVTNIATLCFVFAMFRSDQGDILQKLAPPNDRVITPQVVMTLLGATTVQLGTVMVIMARYIFPTAKLDPA